VPSHIDVVFLDVGGPIYGDRPYYEALLAAIHEVRPDASDAEFWNEFEACRRDQRGPFTERMALRFVDDVELPGVLQRKSELWRYPPDALQPDARSALAALSRGYRLGVLANQERWIQETMARDGIARYFAMWIVSAEVGAEKPDPRIFEHALAEAGVPPERCVMVGDRLDNDIVAARRHGMRGVWMLRGEAPPEPSEQQLAQADASVRGLGELSAALAKL
jgi:HAD superfamily hydrolase (TIGR01549 family)